MIVEAGMDVGLGIVGATLVGATLVDEMIIGALLMGGVPAGETVDPTGTGVRRTGFSVCTGGCTSNGVNALMIAATGR